MTEPKCPICGQSAQAAAYRPFCSRRCSDLDLQRWLSGRYVMPAAEDEREDGGAPGRGDEA